MCHFRRPDLRPDTRSPPPQQLRRPARHEYLHQSLRRDLCLLLDVVIIRLDCMNDQIKFIVNRYKFSTTIFSWDLCNEPRCSGCTSSVITRCTTPIIQYIKSFNSDRTIFHYSKAWIPASHQPRRLPRLLCSRRCRLRQEPRHPHPRLRHLPLVPVLLGLQLHVGIATQRHQRSRRKAHRIVGVGDAEGAEYAAVAEHGVDPEKRPT